MKRFLCTMSSWSCLPDTPALNNKTVGSLLCYRGKCLEPRMSHAVDFAALLGRHFVAEEREHVESQGNLLAATL